MTQSMTKLMHWAVTIAGTAAFLWLMPWSFLAGNMLARIDLARGHSEMLVSGPLNPWSDCGATALHQGDGVDLQSRVLCSISAAETPFDQGYNATMHQAMRDHASRDVREDSVHRAALDRDHGHPRPRQ